MKILVVDDDSQARRILSKVLINAGYDVITAEDGVKAWNILQETDISILITDWMMPEMDGLTLCRKIRAHKFPRYICIILLTAKGEKNDLIEGLEAGADDFLIKPSNQGELKARIRACERIIALERDLEDRNQKLKQTYSLIRKDLEAAAQIQLNLLPKSNITIYGIQFDWLFLPSTFVAGDTFNYFKLDEHHIGFYLLDVAGHGVPAALLSVTLSNILSPGNDIESIFKRRLKNPPYYKITRPADVVRELNQRFQLHDDTMQYFTMIYGIIDTISRRVVITQAGHPSPIYTSLNGNKTKLIGDGGYPVGIFPNINYEEAEFFFNEKDRLTLYSDGITECSNNDMEQFSLNRLIELLEREKCLPSGEIVNQVKENLKKWNGNTEFKDDVTLLNITFL